MLGPTRQCYPALFPTSLKYMVQCQKTTKINSGIFEGKEAEGKIAETNQIKHQETNRTIFEESAYFQ
jgi:hypothetical protein